MLKVVGVGDLKREDVQDLTVSLEHMSANTLWIPFLHVDKMSTW